MHIILISYLILIILQQYSRHLLLFNYVTLYVLLNSTLFTINVKIGKEDLTANLVCTKLKVFFLMHITAGFEGGAFQMVGALSINKVNLVEELHNSLECIFKTSNYPLIKRVYTIACSPCPAYSSSTACISLSTSLYLSIALLGKAVCLFE